LLAGARDVAVGLHDWVRAGVLRRKEWWSNRQEMYCVIVGLIGLAAFRILGSQLFFQPDFVQKRLLSRMRNDIE
jgi:hypothetical protein